MAQIESLSRQHRDFVIRQIDDLIGVPDERTGIAGQEMLTVPHADDERCPVDEITACRDVLLAWLGGPGLVESTS